MRSLVNLSRRISRSDRHIRIGRWPLLIVVLLATACPIRADQPKLAVLVRTESSSPPQTNSLVIDLRNMGVVVSVVLSDDLLLCHMDPSSEGSIREHPRIREIIKADGFSLPHGDVLDQRTALGREMILRTHVGYTSDWNGGHRMMIAPGGCIADESDGGIPGNGAQTAGSNGGACVNVGNHERLRGTVFVSVFFPECDGTVEPQKYSWDPATQQTILVEVVAGLDFLATIAGENGVPLTFRLESYGVERPEVTRQGYEPENYFWGAGAGNPFAFEVMQNMGYTSVNDYNSDMRTAYASDWAFSSYIVNVDWAGLPAGQAFPGAGFHVINEGVFDGIFAHESAHMFGAMDEKDGVGTCRFGRNGVLNLNARTYPCGGTEECVMEYSRRNAICTYTKAHLGWTSVTPTPTVVFPGPGDIIQQGSVTFRWSRRTSSPDIRSSLRIIDDETGSTVYCDERSADGDSRIVQLTPGRYTWRVINGGSYDRGYWSLIEGSAATFVVVEQFPAVTTLLPNFPNPFNPATVISFELSARTHVELSVYSLLGERIEVLVDEILQPMEHQVEFSGKGLPTGTYFYVLRTKLGTQHRTMTLMK